MALLIAFIVAMLITMALVPVLVRFAPMLRIIDLPGGRHVHTTPVPKVGGIAMVVGALAAMFIAVPSGLRPYGAYIAASLVILAFGVWDDRVELRPWAKLAGQLLAILIVMTFGGISIESYTLSETYALPVWIGAPLTVVFILGVTNAINLSDGLDGLAGGTTLLTAARASAARASGW